METQSNSVYVVGSLKTIPVVVALVLVYIRKVSKSCLLQD